MKGELVQLCILLDGLHDFLEVRVVLKRDPAESNGL